LQDEQALPAPRSKQQYFNLIDGSRHATKTRRDTSVAGSLLLKRKRATDNDEGK